MGSQEPEVWNWKKFGKGFFDGRNSAKALVLGFHQTIIIIIAVSVAYLALSYFKPKQQPTVGTNSGTVINDSSNGTSFSLLNLFNFK